MCLAQGHNTVTPVRLKPAASRSQVKRSTTELLCSLPRLLDRYCVLCNNSITVCTISAILKPLDSSVQHIYIDIRVNL